MDLRKVNVDGLIGQITASCAAPILAVTSERHRQARRPRMGGPGARQETARFISRSRQKKPTADDCGAQAEGRGRLHAQESGGTQAVEDAFEVSRSTAKRYINAAKDAGLITRGTK